MLTLAFIVNAFENPVEVNGILCSLKLQWPSDTFRVVIHIADNSKNQVSAEAIQNLTSELGAEYHKTEGNCYTASADVMPQVEADYVCFASSDGYYVPGFSAIMMETAMRYDADLVYCNILYDPRLHGRGLYSVLDTVPEMRWIDKTSFILRKSLFKGWPAHPDNWCDGQLVEDLMRSGAKVAKAKGVLVVHN